MTFTDTLDTVKANTERYQAAVARSKQAASLMSDDMLQLVINGRDIHNHSPEYVGRMAAYQLEWHRRTEDVNDPGYYPNHAGGAV